MGTLFGTDGIRGVANSELTPELAFRLGRAHGHYIMYSVSRPKIVVGKDTRISGDMLEAAYCAGACSVGAHITKLGILPTPAVALLTRHLEAHSGVMISASHNPIEDNGIKLFSARGYKLPDEEEDKIEALLLDGEDNLPRPTGTEVGMISDLKNAEDLYASHVREKVGSPLSGIKIAMDCAYGAAFRVGPRVFRDLGADVIALHDEPDGSRINVQCGSTNTALLKSITTGEGAALGLAFDGDADRCLAVDEKGHRIDGDQILTTGSA